MIYYINFYNILQKWNANAKIVKISNITVLNARVKINSCNFLK